MLEKLHFEGYNIGTTKHQKLLRHNVYNEKSKTEIVTSQSLHKVGKKRRNSAERFEKRRHATP